MSNVDTLRAELPHVDVIFAAKHGRRAERLADAYNAARNAIDLEDETTIERARFALMKLRAQFPSETTPHERYCKALTN